MEKYLKAILIFTTKEKVRYNYHFDNFGKLKAILKQYNCDVTKNFDPVFLSILEKAFKIRYYDNLKAPIKIGLYLNEFIGELDSAVHLFETTITAGMLYKKAVEIKDPHLYQNNFILNKQNKKDFMEMPDKSFSVYIQIGSTIQIEDTAVGRDMVKKYEGRMANLE